jgi:hypothetical protein
LGALIVDAEVAGATSTPQIKMAIRVESRAKTKIVGIVLQCNAMANGHREWPIDSTIRTPSGFQTWSSEVREAASIS